MFPPRHIEDVTWGGAAEDEMARHGVSGWNAQDVFHGDPRFFRQQGKEETDASGRWRIRPDRIKMVGPDAGGRLLTFGLEYPDSEGLSQIVTGWLADKKERVIYRQAR